MLRPGAADQGRPESGPAGARRQDRHPVRAIRGRDRGEQGRGDGRIDLQRRGHLGVRAEASLGHGRGRHRADRAERSERHRLRSRASVPRERSRSSTARPATPPIHSGCHHPAPTFSAGFEPNNIGVDDRTDTVYVPDWNDGDIPGTVSIINGATCNGTDLSGMRQAGGHRDGRHRTVRRGNQRPDRLRIHPRSAQCRGIGDQRIHVQCRADRRLRRHRRATGRIESQRRGSEHAHQHGLLDGCLRVGDDGGVRGGAGRAGRGR